MAQRFGNNVLLSQTYTYDRYGNMTCWGSGLCTSMGYNGNNRMTTVGGLVELTTRQAT